MPTPAVSEGTAPARTKEAGMALVIVILFLVTAAGLGVSFLTVRRSDGIAARGQIDAVRARAALEAGMAETAALIARTRPPRQVPPILQLSLPDGAVRVGVVSEAGKVDLNAAGPELLQGLAVAVGLPEATAVRFAENVVAWRDTEAARRPSRFGRRSNDSAQSAHRLFAHPAELAYALGRDPAAIIRLAPYVTVFTGEPQPQAGLAPPVVREALELAQSLGTGAGDAEQPAGEGEMSDQGPLEGETGAGEDGDAGGPLDQPTGEGEPAQPEATLAEDRSTAFSLLLDARLPNGYEARAAAVIRLAEGQDPRAYRVLAFTPFRLDPSEAP